MAAGAVAAARGTRCGCVVGEGFGAVVRESFPWAAGRGADVGCCTVLTGTLDGGVTVWVL
jgi:3-oxoacyl-(acyl-carrier-protein) synthase